MGDIFEVHRRFLRYTLDLNKYGANIITTLPSVIFLSTNFLIIHKFCHRYTRIGFTSFKAWFFRELTFHWSFFYLSKLWFIFLKAFKITTTYFCAQRSAHDLILNEKHCNLIGLFLLSFLSTIPTIIFLIKTCSRRRIPNFFMWVGEDPWLRTEIGLAGHYLDRPPRSLLPSHKTCAYQTHRSSSTEDTARPGTYLRISKSLD